MTRAFNPKSDGARPQASDPAVDGIAFDGTADVTPQFTTRGVYVGTDGNLQLTMIGIDGHAGTTLTFVAVKAGQIYPFCAVALLNAGTTCSGVLLF